MDGTHMKGSLFFKDISPAECTPAEKPRLSSADFMHPDGVVRDIQLTDSEKREILASWASDVRAVPNAPALRQLDDGTIVSIDDVLRALNSLNTGEGPEQTTSNAFRAHASRRIRLPRRLKLPLSRDRSDDDDDPPPCPAIAAKPHNGPLSGEGAEELALALAA